MEPSCLAWRLHLGQKRWTKLYIYNVSQIFFKLKYIHIYIYIYLSGLNPRQLASRVYYKLVSYSFWGCNHQIVTGEWLAMSRVQQSKGFHTKNEIKFCPKVCLCLYIWVLINIRTCLSSSENLSGTRRTEGVESANNARTSDFPAIVRSPKVSQPLGPCQAVHK